MGGNLYSSALSGLNVAQIGLATTQHNISNANTPGYTRQDVMLTPLTGTLTGGMFIGQGVDVASVTRVYNEFLSTQVLQDQTQANYLSSYYSSIKSLDSMLSDPANGPAAAIQGFFSAANGVASNPESIPARQTMLSNAQFAAGRFKTVDQRLTDIANGVTNQITASVTIVNSYAQQIATLNGNIKRAVSYAQGQQPNDLLDQRDQLIAKLNQEVKTSTVRQPDGTVSVFIGSGQTLVIGEQAMSLKAVASTTDPTKVDLAYQGATSTIVLSRGSLQGGNLGAYLDFRDLTLDPMRNEMGRLALGFAMNVNRQNQSGLDMNGQMGSAVFSVPPPAVIRSTNNLSNANFAATIADPGALTGSDYRLTVNGVNDYTLVRLSDNFASKITGPLPQTVDGFTLNPPSGTPSTGDSFTIRPTAFAARDIAAVATDPTAMAAAAPMRGMAALSNVGSAVISSGTVNLNPVSITFTSPTTFDVTDTSTVPPTVLGTAVPFVAGGNISYNGWTAQLAGAPAAGDVFNVSRNPSAIGTAQMQVLPAAANIGTGAATGGILNWKQPFSVTFNAAAKTYTVTGAVPDVSATPISYTPGSPINLSFNGWSAQITGTPATGDMFNFGVNSNASGDNRNALLMAGLQTSNVMQNGTLTIQGAYGQLVSKVGSKTNELNITSQAQNNLLAESTKAQQSLSGVNLDEEAANLMRYQRAYEAASKALQIAGSMFDAILNIK